MKKLFNKFYLDKEKDIIVNLYQTSQDEITYILETPNHKKGTLITNLAKKRLRRHMNYNFRLYFCKYLF